MQTKQQEFQIEFDYIIDDYKKSSRSNYYTNKTTIIFLIVLAPILLGIIILYYLGIISIIINYHRQATVVEMILLLFAGLVFFFFYLGPLSMSVIKRNWETTPVEQHKTTIVLSEKGIIFQNFFGEHSVSWEYIHKIVELKEFFCIYYNSYYFRLLPKRVLNDENLVIVRNILITNNGKKYSTQGMRKENRI